MTGYSGTPLAKKLGIKEGSRVALLGAPEDFESALQPLPGAVRLMRRARSQVDVVVCFCAESGALKRRLPQALKLLDPQGGLWVGWPKKSSGVPTDISFDRVQGAGLAAGLVDNKVCAIDNIWSGLRFVYRLDDRP